MLIKINKYEFDHSVISLEITDIVQQNRNAEFWEFQSILAGERN